MHGLYPVYVCAGMMSCFILGGWFEARILAEANRNVVIPLQSISAHAFFHSIWSMMTGLHEPSPANDLSAIRVVRVPLAFAVGREPLFATESTQERA